MGLSLVTAPSVEPITTTEAKLHLRVDHADEDALIGGLVTAAREWCEGFQGRAYVTQTWDYTLDSFPGGDGRIEIPKPPLQSITSVSYVDADGATQTVSSSDYTVDTAGIVGSVVPAYGESWPTTRAIPNAVTIRFVAGYGSAADVPETAKAAMKLMLGTYYMSREQAVIGTITAQLPMGVEPLLWMNRVVGF